MEYQNIIIGILITGLPLLLIELIARKYQINPELSRKTAHLVGSISSIFLIYICNFNEIALIAGLFTFGMIVLRKYKALKSLYKINRRSWGEIAFTLGVMLTAMLAQLDKVYIVTILILGLSDTIANLIGTKWGGLKILNTKKTYVGSISFALTTSLILFLAGFTTETVIIVSLLATITEAFSTNGADNITIPLVVVLSLR